MRLNSSWILIVLVFWIAADGVDALRGSELVLQARKQAEEAKPVLNNEAGDNATVAEDGKKDWKLTGNPQIDYIHDPNLPRELNGHNLSNYPFYNAIPAGIEFACDGLHDGFYASVPHHCQVYHHCLFGIRYDFLCANYTAFDQKTFICHFVSEVDCVNSPKYYVRNEALYKTTTSAPIVIPTTKATTPAPERRLRPKKRRPAYEYYYDDEYEDDEEYYDDYQPPPRKRNNKQKANKWRDAEEEDGSKVRPQGAPGTVFDAPRAPPKVRRPVPVSERHKYEYSTISTSPSKVSKLSNTKGSSDSSDEYLQKPDGERRQSEKKRNKKRPNRYENDYYEDEEEEEEEIRPPKKNRNRNDDNWRPRNRNKGHRGDGYRDRPERGGNRGRYQDGPSKRRYENRPTYDDEEEYEDEYEEDSGYRGRYDDNRRKKGEDKRRKDEGQSGGRYDDNKRWKGSRDDRRSGGGRYDSDRRRPLKDDRRGDNDKGKRKQYEDSEQEKDNLYDNDDYDNEPKDSSQVDVESRKKATTNKSYSRRNQPEPTKPSTTTSTTTTTTTTKKPEKPKTTTPIPLTLEDDYYDEYEYDDVIESPDQNKGKGIETTTLGSTTTAKKQEYKYNRFTRREEVKPSTTASTYKATTPIPRTTENSVTTSSELDSSKRFRPRADLKLRESLTEKLVESAFESSFRNQRNNSVPLQPQRFLPTSSINPLMSKTEITTRNYPSFNVRDRTPSRDSFRMRNGAPNLQVTSQPTSLYRETRRPISVTETSERDYSLLSNEFSRGQIQFEKSKYSNDGGISSIYQTTSLTPNRGLRVEYTLDLSQTTPSLPSTKYMAEKPTTRRPDKKVFKPRQPLQTEVPQIDKKPAVIQPRNPSPPSLSSAPEFAYKNQGNQGYVIYNQRIKPVTERQAMLFPKKPPTSFGSTAPGPSAPSGPSANGKILPVRSGYPNYGTREYELEVNEEDYDVAINDGIQPSTLHPTRTAGPNLHIKVNTRGYDVGQPQSTLRAPQANYYQPQHYFSNVRAETVPPNQREYETYLLSAPRYSLNPSRLPQQGSSRSKEWSWK